MSKSREVDYAKMAEGLDQMRELTSAMVAGLVADGFTDEQARGIVAGFFVLAAKSPEEGEEPCRVCLSPDCQGGCM